MPVVRLVFLFTAHVQQIRTTVQYCRYIKNDDHERTNHQIPFNIKGKLQDSPYFSSKNQNGRHNFKIIKMVVLMYEIIKTVVLLLF